MKRKLTKAGHAYQKQLDAANKLMRELMTERIYTSPIFAKKLDAANKLMRKAMTERIFTSPILAKKHQPTIHVVKGRSTHWHVNIVASNGRIMLTSETYDSRSNATRAAKRLAKTTGLEVVE